MNKIIDYAKIIALALVLMAGIATVRAWDPPPDDPPTCPAGTPGCLPPVNVSAIDQTKPARLTLNSLAAVFAKLTNGNDSYQLLNNLVLGVNGKVGADSYCTADGAICTSAANLGSGPDGGVASLSALNGGGVHFNGGGSFGPFTGAVTTALITCPANKILKASGPVGWSNNPGWTCADDLTTGNVGGVSQLLAGDNITLSPEGGTGVVTITATGGTGGGDIMGINTDASGGLSGGVNAGTASLRIKACTAGQILKYHNTEDELGWYCEEDESASVNASVTSPYMATDNTENNSPVSLTIGSNPEFCALNEVRLTLEDGSYITEDAPPGRCSVYKNNVGEWKVEADLAGANSNASLSCTALCLNLQ